MRKRFEVFVSFTTFAIFYKFFERKFERKNTKDETGGSRIFANKHFFTGKLQSTVSFHLLK